MCVCAAQCCWVLSTQVWCVVTLRQFRRLAGQSSMTPPRRAWRAAPSAFSGPLLHGRRPARPGPAPPRLSLAVPSAQPCLPALPVPPSLQRLQHRPRCGEPPSDTSGLRPVPLGATPRPSLSKHPWGVEDRLPGLCSLADLCFDCGRAHCSEDQVLSLSLKLVPLPLRSAAHPLIPEEPAGVGAPLAALLPLCPMVSSCSAGSHGGAGPLAQLEFRSKNGSQVLVAQGLSINP